MAFLSGIFSQMHCPWTRLRKGWFYGRIYGGSGRLDCRNQLCTLKSQPQRQMQYDSESTSNY